MFDVNENGFEFKGWVNWKDSFHNETDERHNLDPDSLCNFGIKFLDDCLVGILKDDLVVIGADSGVGKSTLSLMIAKHNAKRGKRVGVFFLEGGSIEAMRRIKWQDICEYYYSEVKVKNVNMNYINWVMNKTPSVINEIECMLYEKYKDIYKNNLFLYETKTGFGIEDLLSSLVLFTTEYKKKPDLLIIDHLQYFSLTEEETEISAITKILREVKSITEYSKIPIILVSHLKKKYKGRGLPDQEDFYGSSNIPKISSASIILTPNLEREGYPSNIYPTYIRVVKSRTGMKSSYVAEVDFNLETHSYENNYKLYYVTSDGFPFKEPIERKELPRWAKEDYEY